MATKKSKAVKHAKANETKIKKGKKIRPNPFKGVDDVYLTKNKIAVTCVETQSEKRGYKTVEHTKYYVQSSSNLKQ